MSDQENNSEALPADNTNITQGEAIATSTAPLNAAIEDSIRAIQVAADELVAAFRQRAMRLAKGCS